MLNTSLFTEHFKNLQSESFETIANVRAVWCSCRVNLEAVMQSQKECPITTTPSIYLSVFNIKALCKNSIYNLSALCSKKESIDTRVDIDYRYKKRWTTMYLCMQRKGIKMNTTALWRHQAEFESILIFVKLSSKVTTSSSLYVNKVTANILTAISKHHIKPFTFSNLPTISPVCSTVLHL